MGMSYNGWKFGILIEHSRLIHTLVDGEPAGPTLDRESLREQIVGAGNAYMSYGEELPSDELEPFETVYLVHPVEGRHKMRATLRFVGPRMTHVRQIKAARVEANKAAKAARAERAEIARAATKVSKSKSSAASQGGAAPRQRARL